MNLDQLQTFLAVVRHGSFTLAARQLGLSQPAVSRQVQHLERELREALLDRHAGSVEFTPAGRRFLTYAEEMVGAHQRLLADLRVPAQPLRGVLRVAASTTPGEFLVPEGVARFTQQYPRVEPQIFITDTAEVVALVAARQQDVGFTGACLPRASLVYRVVADDEIVLAVPASHPFARRTEIDVADLEGQALIEREGGSGTYMAVRQALAARGLALPPHRMVMSLSTTQAIVSAVQRGLGIGFVSSLALTTRPMKDVVAVRIAALPLRRPLYLVYDERQALQPITRAFIDLASHLQSEQRA